MNDKEIRIKELEDKLRLAETDILILRRLLKEQRENTAKQWAIAEQSIINHFRVLMGDVNFRDVFITDAPSFPIVKT